MTKRKRKRTLGPSERAHNWARKWADYNHPSLDDDPTASENARLVRGANWIGFYTGGCKGWWHGFQAGRRSRK